MSKSNGSAPLGFSRTSFERGFRIAVLPWFAVNFRKQILMVAPAHHRLGVLFSEHLETIAKARFDGGQACPSLTCDW
jgi:hypothetical protein